MGGDCCKTSALAHKCSRNGTGHRDCRGLTVRHRRPLAPVVLMVGQHQIGLHVQPADRLAPQRQPVVDHRIHTQVTQRTRQPVGPCHLPPVDPAQPRSPRQRPPPLVVGLDDIRIGPPPRRRQRPLTWPLEPPVPAPLALDAGTLPPVSVAGSPVESLKRQGPLAVAAPLQTATLAARRIRSCTVALPGSTSSQMSCSRVPRATRT